jgi:cytosine/uracil/thiamine/allantoin permease
MLRSILAVIAGYAAMFVIVFLTMSAAFFAVGPDRAFRPGGYQVTPLWIAIWAVISVGAGVAGGWTTARIARNRAAVGALAGIVLVLGLATGFATLNTPPPEAARGPDTPLTDAMTNARAPAWNAFLTPVIGVVGVIAGAALAGLPRSDAPANP